MCSNTKMFPALLGFWVLLVYGLQREMREAPETNVKIIYRRNPAFTGRIIVDYKAQLHNAHSKGRAGTMLASNCDDVFVF